jgi:hypothetical protein
MRSFENGNEESSSVTVGKHMQVSRSRNTPYIRTLLVIALLRSNEVLSE